MWWWPRHRWAELPLLWSRCGWSEPAGAIRAHKWESHHVGHSVPSSASCSPYHHLHLLVAQAARQGDPRDSPASSCSVMFSEFPCVEKWPNFPRSGLNPVAWLGIVTPGAVRGSSRPSLATSVVPLLENGCGRQAAAAHVCRSSRGQGLWLLGRSKGHGLRWRRCS